MIGMHAGKVGADAGRIGQHGDHVREDADQQHNGGHDLDSPEGGVGVVDQADMVLHVAALMIAAREAAQSAETVDADEERDQADKDHVSPFMGMTADEGKAGSRHQVPEQILGDLDGARECHVAEKENGQQTTGHRLGDIAPGRPLGAAGHVLIVDGTLDVFIQRRRMGAEDIVWELHGTGLQNCSVSPFIDRRKYFF